MSSQDLEKSQSKRWQQSRNERKRHKGCEEKRDLKILHCHTAGFEEKKDPQGKEYIQYLETGKVKK